MAEQSEDFGQMGQTCDECSPCWSHRGWLRICSCDCHPADPAVEDQEHAKGVIGHLQAENKRLRDELRTVTERSEAMKARCKEAIALWRGENKQLRDALGAILDGLTDASGNPMGARPSQVTTLYSIASRALRPIQSGSSEVSDG